MHKEQLPDIRQNQESKNKEEGNYITQRAISFIISGKKKKKKKKPSQKRTIIVV